MAASDSGSTPSLPSPSSGQNPRTLVLCFDGTNDQFETDNSNVVKFYGLLKKDDTENQICYYQPGIGTYLNPGVVAPLFQWGAKIIDEGFAWYLDAHVRGGYTFIMQNWRPGDKICLFGFSRGAYTARALAGMIHKVGLLPKDNPEQVAFAYKLFKRTDKKSIALAEGFKETFCRDVEIEFVGVWETVESVGVIMTHSLPFSTTNQTIKTFRHALALDEHRAKFRPTLYHRPTPTTAKNSECGSYINTAQTSEKPSRRQEPNSPFPPKPFTFRKLKRALRARDAERAPTVEETESDTVGGRSRRRDVVGGTDVLEVWFAGCHADIGGGSVPDSTPNSLADDTLSWMVREVVRSQAGIDFDHAALARSKLPEDLFTWFSIDAESTPVREKTAAKAADCDANGSAVDLGPYVEANALSPIYDQLVLDKWWLLLEIVPTQYSYQDAQDVWRNKWSIHLGKGREIHDGPNFHVTVLDRMQKLAYTPKATWKKGTETYVL